MGRCRFPIYDLQRLLAADASACASARTDFHSIPCVWHTPQPDEPKHLHNMRVHVHAGDEGLPDHRRRVCALCRLRGYTTVSQSLPAATVSSLLDVFYDECAEAIWEYDGLLNKTVGDAIMAIFNFPIHHDDHAERTVRASSAAVAILAMNSAFPRRTGLNLASVSGSTLARPVSESSVDRTAT